MNNPLVSVITPTFNRRRTIERVWDSLQVQSYSKFEWIVVDDGSTDDTEKYIRSIDDSRIVYQKQFENRGQNFARNRGVEKASGEYIVFLDSDDEIIPEALDVMVRKWEDVGNSEIGVISFRCLDGRTGKIVGYLEEDNLELGYKDILCENKANGEFFSIIKNEVFNNNRFPEQLRCFEGLFWTRIAKNWKTLYVDTVLRIYHKDAHDRISSIQNVFKSARDLAFGYRTLYEEHTGVFGEYCEGKLGKYRCLSALYYAISGDKKNAFDQLKKSFRYKGDIALKVVLLLLILLGKRVTRTLFRARSWMLGKIEQYTR